MQSPYFLFSVVVLLLGGHAMALQPLQLQGLQQVVFEEVLTLTITSTVTSTSMMTIYRQPHTRTESSHTSQATSVNNADHIEVRL
jgi:hypothetical protein